VTTERWRRVEEIFNTAVTVAPAKRAQVVAEACQGDAALQSEVLSLLQYEESADNLLNAAMCSAVREVSEVRDPDIGLQIGPYQVVSEIGRGGMGAVYVAVRSDPHYLQTVAIKLIPRGLNSAMIVQRFRQERQILANLTHPNIGSILDGGSTDDGRPYIVMEFIEGEPITDYCEKLRLGINKRIELFRTVCSAVHHAHQKLVIHRDIKPGNVLVDTEGMVKLIDFGVAKLLAPDLVPGGPPSTEVANRLMTPDYASPEQLRGEELTTATDVYSLGVLLYELLTQRRPFRVTGHSYRDMEKIVCSEEPARPSEVAGLPAGLHNQLKGDLDNIVLKAISKERERRYSSAGQLAEDLSRYVRGEPVIARRDTFRYRTGKLIKRYRVAILTTGLAFLSLVAGLITAAWQRRRAEQRFQQVRELATSLIFDVSDSIREVPGTAQARASLVRTAIPYLDSLVTESGNNPGLMLELGRAYEKIGDLQGELPSLSRPAEALESYRKSQRLLEPIAFRASFRDAAVEHLIEVHQSCGRIEANSGSAADAIHEYTQALQLARQHLAENPKSEERQRLLASSCNRLGDAQLTAGDPERALGSLRIGLQVFGSTEPRTDAARSTLSTGYLFAGDALVETGPLPQARASYQHAAAIRQQLCEHQPNNLQYRQGLFVADTDLGNVLGGARAINMGDSAGAFSMYREALRIAEDLTAQDPKEGWARTGLAIAYTNMGDAVRNRNPRQALDWYHRALSIMDGLPADTLNSTDVRRSQAQCREGIAEALRRTGNRPAALVEWQKTLAIWNSVAEAEPDRADTQYELLRSTCRLSDLERELRNTAKAIEERNRALAVIDRVAGQHSSLNFLRELAGCYEVFGRMETQMARGTELSESDRLAHRKESEDWYRKSVDVWNKLFSRDVGDPTSALRREAVLKNLAAAAGGRQAAARD
jgi:tetratricopeptide (TPR) repeat protein